MLAALGFEVPMDILHLVDRLEELFNHSRAIPLTRQVVVDEDRIMEIIDQMRVSIPEEIKQAREVIAKRDRVMAQAQEEAARTVELARNKSSDLVDRDSISQAAHARAEQILVKARSEADLMRAASDNYVLERLRSFEGELDRILSQVRNGIEMLQGEQPQNEDEQGPA